eukprot:1371752-Amphidinium_carterae.1
MSLRREVFISAIMRRSDVRQCSQKRDLRAIWLMRKGGSPLWRLCAHIRIACTRDRTNVVSILFVNFWIQLAVGT